MKQPTFCYATTGYYMKWHLRNVRRNAKLMTVSLLALCSASDWLRNMLHPIWSITQIWVVTRHRDGISTLVPQTSNFRGQVVIYRYILSGCSKIIQKNSQRQNQDKKGKKEKMNPAQWRFRAIISGKIHWLNVFHIGKKSTFFRCLRSLKVRHP